MSKLLIVESPNKVKSIKGFLGADWEVAASVGHITTLASDGNERLGFEITEQGVSCRYVANGERGESVIKKLKGLASRADSIWLATDPDREGEAIAWHLQQQICGKKPIHRVTYTQITEAAVKAAIANPRQLDMALVNAQRSRQCLDKRVGFKLSRIVSNGGGGKSAGRVQSAALQLLVARERQIAAFKPVPYWSLSALYGEGFTASYLGSEAIADTEEEHTTVNDAADPSEAGASESKQRVTTLAEADRLVGLACQNPHRVTECTSRNAQKAPPPALTTSALQQAAGVRYGFSSDLSMSLAQELFEGVQLPDGSRHGAITYHRTDSVDLSPEFCEEVRHWLSEQHPDLVPTKTTKHKAKEGAQGAHEAIRPVEVKFTPEAMQAFLSDDQLKLYTLIWQRAVASQCAPAQLAKSRVVVQAGATFWEARGSILKAPGYTTILADLGSDTQLPAVQEGQTLTVQKVWHEAKKTTPPGRFTEPSLVQTLERLGIGRPSTFANIIKTLKDREYVTFQKKSMVPTALGMKTTDILAKVFPAVIDSKFTAKMETDLDLIAAGEKEWEQYLITFDFKFFRPALTKAGIDVDAVDQPREYAKSEVPCPGCSQPLSQVPYRKAQAFSSKPFFLKCTTCIDLVLFWNDKAAKWLQKGEASGVPKTPEKLTAFVCQCCGKPLAEISYSKDGVSKLMLKCSGDCGKDDKKKELAVYFQSKKGGFWNFTLAAEPLTAKLAGSATKPAGKGKPSSTKALGKAPAQGKSKTT